MELKTKLTVKELYEIYPPESRVELINGEVYEMPAPTTSHQRVLFRIAKRLDEAKGKGEVLIAPVDVMLSEDILLQPDLVLVLDTTKVKDRVEGVPDLVVEVVSPSSLKRDVVDKFRLYEKYGVKEYWLVFPAEKSLLIFTLTDKGYELFSEAHEKGRVKSKLIEGFELEVSEVFQEAS